MLTSKNTSMKVEDGNLALQRGVFFRTLIEALFFIVFSAFREK